MEINHLKFTLETKLFPIIGYPMGQSSASYAYNPLFAGNDIDEIMWPVEIKPGQLEDFLSSVKTLGIKHFCLTMPHKSPIIPLLDEVDEESRLFNSVNIVKIDESGRSIGTGMDGKGNLAAIERAGVDLKGKNVLILGSGSIVGVILLEFAKRGVKSVTLANRTIDKAERLKKVVEDYLSIDMEINCISFEKDAIDKASANCDFLMQATALGLKGYGQDYEYLGFLDYLRDDAIVMENIVNPPHTKFAKRALELGHKVIYGIDMMLGQVGEIFEFCYGFPPTEESMNNARNSVYQYFNFNP